MLISEKTEEKINLLIQAMFNHNRRLGQVHGSGTSRLGYG